jgi:hypothetical protein
VAGRGWPCDDGALAYLAPRAARITGRRHSRRPPLFPELDMPARIALVLDLGLALGLAATGCHGAPAAPPAAGPSAASGPSAAGAPPMAPPKLTAFAARSLALPGAAPYVLMDYIVFNPRTRTVWAPAGNTAAVDVVDVATRHVAQVTGFATREVERNGQKRTIGPSSAAIGAPGTVYVGNRGDSSVCAVDEVKLTLGTCGKLDASPDGLIYVAGTNEVWVTTPRDSSIRILDGTTLAEKAKLTLDGQPEGFAVDATRNRFYTNLEDKDRSLAIDLTSHAVVATWNTACGEGGPHGIRLAEPEGFLVLACPAKLEVLDVGRGGAIVGTADTGEGVDDIDYAPASHLIYVGAGRAGKLTIVWLDARGALTPVAVVPTRPGARNPAAASDGSIYLQNAQAGELVVVSPAR